MNKQIFVSKYITVEKVIVFQVKTFRKFNITFIERHFYLHRVSIFFSVLELLRIVISNGKIVTGTNEQIQKMSDFKSF